MPQNRKIARIRLIPSASHSIIIPVKSVADGAHLVPKPQMTDVERGPWIVILEAASHRPGDEINDEWEWLLDQLDLSAECFLAVLETIRQGRWRTAKNPRAYVKTVAKREARKMG